MKNVFGNCRIFHFAHPITFFANNKNGKAMVMLLRVLAGHKSVDAFKPVDKLFGNEFFQCAIDL